MDEREAHVDESDLDDQDIDDDGDSTPDDTAEADDRKEAAEEAREKQKSAWLRNIKDGKKSLDDMPGNLAWLKKDPDFDEFRKKETKPDETEVKVQKALKSEREKEELEYLTSYLEEGDEDGSISSEKLADIQSDYESLIADGASKKTALQTAMRLNGIKDAQTIVGERKRKGLLLPPRGNQKRRVLKKGDEMTDMEKKFSEKSSLPPGFRS